MGDKFSENSAINWDSPRQAIKVLNLLNDRQELIVAEKYNKMESKNLKTYFLAQNQLSTRKGAALNAMELGLILNDTYYLLDPIIVETKLPVNDTHFFFVTYEYEGESINKKLPVVGASLVFDNSLFMIDGSPIEPHDLNISVWYMDTQNQNRTLIADKMVIVPL